MPRLAQHSRIGVVATDSTNVYSLMFLLVMQETWQDEDGSNDLLYRAILHSTAAAIYHWLTQDGDRKKEKHGFSDMYMYCHFLQINCHCNGIITRGFIILI